MLWYGFGVSFDALQTYLVIKDTLLVALEYYYIDHTALLVKGIANATRDKRMV